MDSRGHGRSSFDNRQITYRRMADDTLALLDHLGIEQTDLVGWSDGAIIALDIALRVPDRLGRWWRTGATSISADIARGNEEAAPNPDMERLFARVPEALPRAIARNPTMGGIYRQPSSDLVHRAELDA